MLGMSSRYEKGKEMNKFKSLWRKLFYRPPKSWTELRKWCSGCSMEAPNFFEDFCQTCKAMEDYIENEKATGRWYKP